MTISAGEDSSIQVAARLAAVPPSGVAEMLRLGSDLRRQGVAVAYLVQGEPDFATPGHIIAAATDALHRGETHYVEGEGLPELRRAIADKARLMNGILADPAAEVLVTTGATLGLYAALMAVVNAGDDVLLFDPGYGPYEAMVRLVGARSVAVPLQRDSGRFCLDLDAVREHITPQTAALVLNSPHNPTGMVLSRTELQGLAELALTHHFVLISDEVYESLVFDQTDHISPAALTSDIKAQTIVVNSFSKTYAMTGWRLGYNIASPRLTRAMTEVVYQTGRCAPAFTQHAGIAALTGPQDAVKSMLAAYAERRLLMHDLLNTLPGVKVPAPAGTFYYFPDLSSVEPDSWRLSRDLVARAHVVTTPGAYYGRSSKGHLRLSFACQMDEIREGIGRLAEYLQARSIESDSNT